VVAVRDARAPANKLRGTLMAAAVAQSTGRSKSELCGSGDDIPTPS
jgi:hypothetical protein